MMGLRRERENGFYGRRRWVFDVGDFLFGLLLLAGIAFVAVVLLKLPSLAGRLGVSVDG